MGERTTAWGTALAVRPRSVSKVGQKRLFIKQGVAKPKIGGGVGLRDSRQKIRKRFILRPQQGLGRGLRKICMLLPAEGVSVSGGLRERGNLTKVWLTSISFILIS